MMSPLPPNDPARNERNNRMASKNDGRSNNNGGAAPVDVLGDMRDAPAVVAMFMIGIATWFLQERCIC